MSEQIGAVLVFVGLFLATSGLLVFIFRSLRVLLGRTERRRLLGPTALLVAGLVIGSVPFAAQRLYFSIVGLAERERVVDGRQALVLTGWDRSDYSILAKKPGLEILEIGNADVTDATLDLLVSERLLGIHPMTGLIEVVGGVAGKAVNGLLAGTLIDEAWKGINAEVATHFLDCYRELLRG
jgi:hypothetical protein